ncbi:MAG: tetratricopeptide repeat protein [Roseburia sp.]
MQKYELIEVESRIESNLGSLHMECGQYSDARDYLEQAHLDYKRVPEGARRLASLTAIYNNLALCYMKSGSLRRQRNISANWKQSAKRILRRWITFM